MGRKPKAVATRFQAQEAGPPGKDTQPWRLLALHTHPPHTCYTRTVCVQAGVPAVHRAWAWMEMSGAAALRTSKPASYYSGLVAKADPDSDAMKQIELVGGCWLYNALMPVAAYADQHV